MSLNNLKHYETWSYFKPKTLENPKFSDDSICVFFYSYIFYVCSL